MNPKIVIIDYQLSNLFSVKRACDFAGFNSHISSNPKELMAADGAILPGVGAFGNAMANLESFGLIKVIKKFIETGKPFFGICLGMQLLFSESEEFGQHKGLNLIKGQVLRFPRFNSKRRINKIPQIGWNKIYTKNGKIFCWRKSPLKETDNNSCMYLVHSFYVKPADPGTILCLTNYEGFEYCSGIMQDNIFAVQFHPEKSGQEGLKIYQNWGKLLYEKKIRS